MTQLQILNNEKFEKEFMVRKKLAIVLGIRPDVIRASLVLNTIRKHPEVDVTFIWSGQHYSDNLKDIFFRELEVLPPEIELGAKGTTGSQGDKGTIGQTMDIITEKTTI